MSAGFKQNLPAALGGLLGAAIGAWLLFSLPLGAAQTAPPVNLGAPGLDLELRLWLLESGETTAEAWPVDDVTATDLGDGDYLFSGLPDAGGTDRYVLLVATSTEPERALVRYEWGAEPGTSVVFRQEVALVAGTTIVEDDTAGAIQVVVRSGLAAAPSSAVFTMANADTGAALVTNRPATVSNVVLDVVTGSYGATFTYAIEAAASNVPGVFDAEFRATMPDGDVQTIPIQSTLRITVRRKL